MLTYVQSMMTYMLPPDRALWLGWKLATPRIMQAAKIWLYSSLKAGVMVQYLQKFTLAHSWQMPKHMSMYLTQITSITQ
ncbi:hypothetical protein GPICK_09005 [Geobacter pickeringii]|uniref:Uncharacterized protein n=1 Tax=Geobacter pickeringii TaxID=345632 RepID=A0A0B5BE91_9BACT|nr:hypothetical protein GPICK_09005 [Geobacter pickeringii]